MATQTLTLIDSKEERERRNPRGVFQRVPGKNSPWWIRYIDAQGRFRREKAGTKGAAIDLYRKRKNEALEGKKLPEKLRRATVTFADIAKDALAYSKALMPGRNSHSSVKSDGISFRKRDGRCIKSPLPPKPARMRG